jgi:hypothetical protein
MISCKQIMYLNLFEIAGVAADCDVEALCKGIVQLEDIEEIR